MSPAELEILREHIQLTIKETVNGKIDRMDEKLDAHIKVHEAHLIEVKPILDAYQGGKVLGDLVKWIAGLGLAVLAIKGWFIR